MAIHNYTSGQSGWWKVMALLAAFLLVSLATIGVEAQSAMDYHQYYVERGVPTDYETYVLNVCVPDEYMIRYKRGQWNKVIAVRVTRERVGVIVWIVGACGEA